MRKMSILLPLLSVLSVGVAHAESKAVRVAPPGCVDMQEQINLTVNFNIMAESFTQAKAKFDEKMRALEESAKKLNAKKFELQSLNYNINSNYNNGSSNYQLNGNASYQMDNATAAFKVAESLTEQKFQVGVNASSYKNGSCNTNPMTE